MTTRTTDDDGSGGGGVGDNNRARHKREFWSPRVCDPLTFHGPNGADHRRFCVHTLGANPRTQPAVVAVVVTVVSVQYRCQREKKINKREKRRTRNDT